jgi:hypothetical protein
VLRRYAAVRRERKGDPLFHKLDEIGGNGNTPVHAFGGNSIEVTPVVRN